MDVQNIDKMLHVVQTSSPHTVGHSELTPPMILQSKVKPPVNWRPDVIESEIGVKLPEELKFLWSKASEIRLNEDVNYGQWGCILWSPAEIVVRHKEALGCRGPDDFQSGDLIIGEFRGDSDLVVLRCGSSQKGFGKVIIALAMDPRGDWPCVASSITEFVMTFLSNLDTKFWEAAR